MNQNSIGQATVTRQLVDRTNALLSFLKEAETGRLDFLVTGGNLDLAGQALGDVYNLWGKRIEIDPGAKDPPEARRRMQ